MLKAVVCFIGCLALMSGAPNVAAQEFYSGKSINLLVGTTAGSGYDGDGRLVARHLGRFIPGSPNVVVTNLPGASGIRAANEIFVRAPKDGTSIGTFNSAFPFMEAIQSAGVQYKSQEFSWIGNLSQSVQVIVVWHSTGVKSLNDVRKREVVMGALGVGGTMSLFPRMLNDVFQTKFKVVTGYAGGNAVNLAMERGEIEGRGAGNWSSWKHTHPDWIRDGKIIPLLQIGPQKDVDLPDVPLLLDLAEDSEQRQIFQLVGGFVGIEVPFVAPPGIPADRLAILRNAFNRMTADPAFLADAKRMQTDVQPQDGEKSAAIVRTILTDISPDVRAKVRDLVGRQ